MSLFLKSLTLNNSYHNVVLTNSKIVRIIEQKSTGRLGTNDIALLQHVHPSRVRQLWSEYVKTGQVPQLKKADRLSRIITELEEEEVVNIYRECPSNAVALECLLRKKGINLPHNMIHTILKKHGLASEQRNKQKRKKWVKYERKHTNSLWHTDWYMVMDRRWMGRWLIVYIDDASRFITGWGLFDEATTEKAISVLDKAISEYGKPASILTYRPWIPVLRKLWRRQIARHCCISGAPFKAEDKVYSRQDTAPANQW